MAVNRKTLNKINTFMLKLSKKHLAESQCTYFEHLKFAVYAGGVLLIAAVASFIHAIIPALFQGISAYSVIRLYHQRLINHPNNLYQEWIKNESNNQRNSSS